MIRFESLVGTEGGRVSGRLRRDAGWKTLVCGFGIRSSVPNRFNSYIHRGEVEIVKRRVRSIILL